MQTEMKVAINDQICLEHISDGLSRKILSFSEQMMVVEVYFEKGTIGEVHTHPHEQIAYVVRGKFKFVVEDKTIIVSQGDSIHFSTNQSHGVTCLESGILLDTFTPCRSDFIGK